MEIAIGSEVPVTLKIVMRESQQRIETTVIRKAKIQGIRIRRKRIPRNGRTGRSVNHQGRARIVMERIANVIETEIETETPQGIQGIVIVIETVRIGMMTEEVVMRRENAPRAVSEPRIQRDARIDTYVMW
jgi:hypothetical protein